GSPFYQHNLEAGRDVSGFVNAIRAHEEMGNGSPRSGHGGAMKEILQTPTGDPRRVIEGLFAPSREKARQEVDRSLHEIEHRLGAEPEAPLAEIWPGTIDFYEGYQGRWIPAEGFRVPGPDMRG